MAHSRSLLEREGPGRGARGVSLFRFGRVMTPGRIRPGRHYSFDPTEATRSPMTPAKRVMRRVAIRPLRWPCARRLPLFRRLRGWTEATCVSRESPQDSARHFRRHCVTVFVCSLRVVSEAENAIKPLNMPMAALIGLVAMMRKSSGCRPVTPEVAGSSPVGPAIYSATNTAHPADETGWAVPFRRSSAEGSLLPARLSRPPDERSFRPIATSTARPLRARTGALRPA